MKIAGYLQTTLIDWPGKVAGVVWTIGCNFRCPFCHNRDLVLPDHDGILKLVQDDTVIEDLKKRKKWIDGLVITGGEPLMYSDIFNFCRRVKELGMGVKIDTNGSFPIQLKKIIDEGLVDYVAMDYKTQIDNYQELVLILGKKGDNPPRRAGKGRPYVGAGFMPARIKKSMGILAESGIEYEFRTTVVPGIHNEEVLMRMGREIKKISNLKFKNSKHKRIIWYWQNFQPKNCLDKEFEKVKPFSRKELERMIKKVKKVFQSVELRG